jgi:CheY-like chemotaxis protein
MNLALGAAPDTHAVLFYEDPTYLYRAIAAFVAEGFANGDPVVLIARPQTFEGVIAHLASLQGMAPRDVEGRFLYLDASSALDQILDGGMPDPVRFNQAFAQIRAHIDRVGPQRPAYLYGEMVHLLCERGDHLAAVRMEELWNAQRAGFNWSVMCAYGLETFDDDVNAHQFRAVCRQHTDIIPAEGFTNAPDDRTRFEHVALLQQQGRALRRSLLQAPPVPFADPHGAIVATTFYVIDDDPSVRRSLARLLSSVELRVHAFESAEAFLARVHDLSAACVIVDVQLVGMSGPELQSRLGRAPGPVPIIAMSGADDVQTEKQILDRGAAAFLRKPFGAQALFSAIERALHV